MLPARAIEMLAELYRGRPLTNPQSPGPVNDAVITSQMYASYYHHTFPFDRAAVRRAWSKCEGNLNAVLDCKTARRLAEANLGPIGFHSRRH